MATLKATIPMLCEMYGWPAPQVEYSFHPRRRWRFDFAWPSDKIAVEIDGGVWRRGGGAHSRPGNIIRDIEKHNAAMLLGWRVLRVLPEWVGNGVAAEMMAALFGGDDGRNKDAALP